MTHQCPKCELRFTWPTELEDHCRSDHPGFHHDYPASVAHDYSTPAVPAAGRPAVFEHEKAADILATYWNER
jgi:hypothetical protein